MVSEIGLVHGRIVARIPPTLPMLRASESRVPPYIGEPRQMNAFEMGKEQLLERRPQRKALEIASFDTAFMTPFLSSFAAPA